MALCRLYVVVRVSLRVRVVSGHDCGLRTRAEPLCALPSRGRGGAKQLRIREIGPGSATIVPYYVLVLGGGANYPAVHGHLHVRWHAQTRTTYVYRIRR